MPLAEPWRIDFIIAHRPSFALQAKTSMFTLGICTLLSIHIFFKRPFLHSSRHLETLLRTCTIENTDRLYENVSNSSKTIQLGSICLALVVTCSCPWSFSYKVWRHGLSGRRGKDSRNGRSQAVKWSIHMSKHSWQFKSRGLQYLKCVSHVPCGQKSVKLLLQYSRVTMRETK